MTVVVRPIAATDDVSALGPAFGPDVDEPRRRRTIVAVDGDQLVGAASATWSSRHPDLVQGALEVLPTHRRRGIGTQLLHALQDLAGGALELVVDAGAAAEGFLRSRDFAPVVESHVVRVTLDDVTLGAFADVDGTTGATVEQADPYGEAAECFEQLYAQAHTWAGRYVPTPGRPWLRWAGEPIVGTTCVARRAGRAVTAACLTTGPFAGDADAFLPPTGTLLDHDDPQAAPMLRAVVGRALAAGAAAGVRHVSVEFDTPYAELSSLISTLATTTVSQHAVWMPRSRFTAVDPSAPEARWALTEYFTELDRRFEGGFDVAAALAEPSATLAAPNGVFLLAFDGSEVVACGGIVFLDDTTGEVKRMWVRPDRRGRGLAARLLATLEAQIAATGRSRVVLDTNGVLTTAIAMYGRQGYEPIERYNDNVYAQHWFAKHL